MLVSLLRFFRGYVDFTAKGMFPERFLNITARSGINLWDHRPTKDGLCGSMALNDYRYIRKTARKAKVTLRIEHRHGLPFIINKYKSRIGLPIGAVAGFVLIMVLSNFIWSINITGTQTISDTYLLGELEKYGVSVGAYKNSIDADDVKREIQITNKKIGWMSVNITGNIVSVEVKENAPKPQLDTNKNPCNLKAKCDGVITKTNVKSGVTNVMIGSGVTKGDLLVSGVSESHTERLDTLTYLRASGEIFADVNSEKELTLSKEIDYYSINENTVERNQISFLWFKFPYSLSFKQFPYNARNYKTQNLYLNDITLPVGITTQTDYELSKHDVVYDSDTVKNIFENESLIYELFSKGSSTLKSRELKILEKDSEYICNISYIFNENIAESVEFTVTE
ncbi:MAG: sporulation protein YqfD [Ruminococcus sp.]|nr:sporulation protein YqfD [Ruminococcus sp.]